MPFAITDSTPVREVARGAAQPEPFAPGWPGSPTDGRPYDGTGVGRAWPLLTGERAHYELAAGRTHPDEHLAQALETIAGDALLPEQVWDSADIPARELFIGHASGSAMPLVWAHAEYLKLCRSLFDGRIFDQPAQTVERYLVHQTTSDRIIWRFNNKVRSMPANKTLRVETLAPAVVHWSADGWRTTYDTATRDTTLGVHLAALETRHLSWGDRVHLTFYWPEAQRWEGSTSSCASRNTAAWARTRPSRSSVAFILKGPSPRTPSATGGIFALKSFCLGIFHPRRQMPIMDRCLPLNQTRRSNPRSGTTLRALA